MSVLYTSYRQSIINLKVLSNIKEGDRICCSGNELSLRIESDSYLQSVRRFFTGESRQTAIQSMRVVVSTAIEHSKVMASDREIIITKKEKNEYINSFEKERYVIYSGYLNSIREELGKAMSGIHHLKTSTYQNDVNVVSELDVIIEEITHHISVLEAHITKHSGVVIE